MNKTLKITSLIIAAACITSSCDKTPEQAANVNIDNGLLILNNGNWGSNDASLSYYDLKSKSVSASVFSNTNGYGLGDLGQDILRDGDKYYISVSGSKTLFITDLKLKVIEKITPGYQPRCLSADDKYIYVSLYEGYLGRIAKGISPAKLETTKVGPNPEGIAIADGKAWVANSGGYVTDSQGNSIYNNTVSVVDLNTFSETSTVTVNTNPKDVCTLGGSVYVSSLGNYYDIPAKLQRIDTSTESVSNVDVEIPYSICCDGSVLHLLCAGYDSNWNLVDGIVYEIASEGARPVKITEGIKDSYSVSCAADGGFIVGCSDYKTEGKVLLYNRKGNEIETIDSKGLNPIRVLDIR